MKYKFFVDLAEQRIEQQGFEKARISVEFSSSKEGSFKIIHMKARNDTNETVYIKRAGLVINGIENGKNPDWRVFIDPGRCAWAGVKRLEWLDYDEKMGVIQEQKTTGGEDDCAFKFHRSDLQTVVWDSTSNYAVLAGFLCQRYGENKVDIIPGPSGRTIDCLEAWQAFDFELPAGAELDMDDFVVIEGSSPYVMLEQYAKMIKNHHGLAFDAPPVVGMMTWYGYRTSITQDIVIENLDIVKDLFEGYPQDMDIYMIIDHGWQHESEWGSLDNDSDRFPEGMKWLGDKIKSEGIKFGIWHTPFCITEHAKNYDDLTELMDYDADGKLSEGKASVWYGYNYKNRGSTRKLNFFDGANPMVQQRWENEFAKFKDWGATYCKIDFFHLVKGKLFGKDITIGDLYRKTWKSFRDGFGEENYLAPCSAPTNMQLGYADSIRIAADIGNAGKWPGAGESYKYGHSTLAALWYKQRNFWINDADSIQIAKGCSMGEARVRATAAAMVGGHLMVSEDIRGVDPQRLDIIRRLLPAMEHTAVPVNLFENPFPEGYPSVWSLDAKWKSGPRKVISIFNFESKTKQYKITAEMLGIEANREFIAMEWWQCKWLGKFDNEMVIEVPAEDCAVIHAVQTSDFPEVISVQHHISGGYILDNVMFNKKTKVLSGTLCTKPGIATVLFGHMPDGWKLAPQMSFHGTQNNSGGWQHEIVAQTEYTDFEICFERAAV